MESPRDPKRITSTRASGSQCAISRVMPSARSAPVDLRGPGRGGASSSPHTPSVATRPTAATMAENRRRPMRDADARTTSVDAACLDVGRTHRHAAHSHDVNVITKRRAEEPSLCELEEEAGGGNGKYSAQLGPSWHLGTLPMAALSRLSVREQYPGVTARSHQIRRALSSPTP